MTMGRLLRAREFAIQYGLRGRKGARDALFLICGKRMRGENRGYDLVNADRQ